MQAPPSIPAPIRPPLREAHARLKALYGDRLRRVILYGSQARGDARADSDVDVLVVLEGPIEPYAELKRMVGLKIDLFEHYGLTVSLQPYDEVTFQQPNHPFMTNVRAEGVEL